MSFLAWNCRGFGNQAIVQVLMDLVHTKRSDVIFLMETMVNQHKLQPIKMKLGFYGLFSVDSEGHSGGLALMCREGTDITITNYSKNHIDYVVVLEGGTER